MNSGSQCYAVLLEENSSSSCQEQCNLCKYGSTQAATTGGTETSEDNADCTECMNANFANTSLDMESVCLACIDVCSPSDQLFCGVCHSHVNDCPGTTTTLETVAISFLPTWSLKWCPRRIGSNPNRHFEFVNFLHFYIFEQTLPFAG